MKLVWLVMIRDKRGDVRCEPMVYFSLERAVYATVAARETESVEACWVVAAGLEAAE